MQLRVLHILCHDGDKSIQAADLVEKYDCIINQWTVNNDDSISHYFLVNEQDQELYDALQDIAEENDSIRMMVQSLDASFPKDFQDKEQGKEENTPAFFDCISREEMSDIVCQQARLNGSFLSLIVLSSIVATIALIQGNVAILIGAMVLTPLLGPNLALAFSAATSNGTLAKRAAISGIVGFSLTFIVALATGFITGESADTSLTPMLISYGFESIPIAVCAGLAATILLLQGTLSSLIGVMVAVAFLPPLAMTGLALSAQDYFNSMHALMLFAINLACFNLAAKAVLLVAGIRPRRDDKNLSRRHVVYYLLGWVAAVMLLSVGIFYKN